MSILVFLEHHGDELQKGSLSVLSKAASLGAGDVYGVVAGSGVRDLVAGAGKYGASKVFVADDAALEKSSSCTGVSTTSASPPVSFGSNVPERKIPIRGVSFQPTVT